MCEFKMIERFSKFLTDDDRLAGSIIGSQQGYIRTRLLRHKRSSSITLTTTEKDHLCVCIKRCFNTTFTI